MKTTLLSIAIFLLAIFRVTAAPNPIDGELFPPDFLMDQHEALGLNETQLQEIQSTMKDVQPKFEILKSQLEDRMKAFQDAIHQTKPDEAQAEEKLRALLTQENEMKVMQVRLMLTLRSKLTPEQVEKARQLRQQRSSQTPSADQQQGLAERLKKKFEQLKTIAQARATGGQPPADIVAKAQEIQQLVQNGQPLEAERQLDALLATLGEAKP